MSTQHSEDITTKKLREAIISEVIEPVIPKELRDKDIKFHINPTGRFVIGGPQGDAGLTGRKIIVDTYGGMGRHGGGAFSGKDPSKVDRSAFLLLVGCKNIAVPSLPVAVGAGRVRDRCRRPVSVMRYLRNQTVPETESSRRPQGVRLTPRGYDLSTHEADYSPTLTSVHFGALRRITAWNDSLERRTGWRIA